MARLQNGAWGGRSSQESLTIFPLTGGRRSPSFAVSAPIRGAPREEAKESIMAWTAPIIEEVTCGMEINMYFPAEEGDDDLF